MLAGSSFSCTAVCSSACVKVHFHKLILLAEAQHISDHNLGDQEGVWLLQWRHVHIHNRRCSHRLIAAIEVKRL